MTKDEALKLALEALKHGITRLRRFGAKGCIPLHKAITEIKEALAQPAPPPPECKTEAEQTAYAFGWWKALETVRAEPDWKDQYEKQKRRAEMWIAKYEKDIGSLEKAAPIAQEPVITVRAWRDENGDQTAEFQGLHKLPDGEYTLYTTPQQQEPRNFCPRCGKRTADLTVIHTCTPPEGGHQ